MPMSSRPGGAEAGHNLVTLTFDHPVTDLDIEALRVGTEAAAAVRVPARVREAYSLGAATDFKVCSTPEVGQLLSVLAAAVPHGGRILELGTGVGAGLAWVVDALGQRCDVQVLSIELDEERAALVRAVGWPGWVSIMVGDCWRVIGSLGLFDLVFADIPGKETYDLSGPIAALKPGGILIIDDVYHTAGERPERRARLNWLRDQLFGNSDLSCADLPFSSGVLLAVRHRG